MSQQTIKAALSWGDLKTEVGCKKTPVVFSWKWAGGSGHVMVAVGYEVRAGDNYVIVHDPQPLHIGRVRSLPYDSYVKGLTYTHWNDYYDIHP